MHAASSYPSSSSMTTATSMSSISDVTWTQSESACYVGATGPDVVSDTWFRKRVDRHFCNRVTQIQPYTNSCDQGAATDILAGSWTWFELAILKDETSTEPKSKDGHNLVWRSHSNRLANATSPTRHFGAVLDRRSDLLVNLEVRRMQFVVHTPLLISQLGG
jgi:hypothetical protein